MDSLSENLRLLRYPLNPGGMKMGRNVSVMRLSTGKLIIHSTARFAPSDLEALRDWGEPSWMVEATNFHDTLARAGVAAFPDLPYLTPSGFPLARKLNAVSLESIPSEWEGEVDVIRVEGMPKINEHVFFHRDSKTLIVADLIFHIPDSAGWFTHAFLGVISGIRQHPGSSRMFRFMVKDRAAFEVSLKNILDLDFERIVVGHGEPIETNAKETLSGIFRELGYAV